MRGEKKSLRCAMAMKELIQGRQIVKALCSTPLFFKNPRTYFDVNTQIFLNLLITMIIYLIFSILTNLYPLITKKKTKKNSLCL